jgi:hypothetical protein
MIETYVTAALARLNQAIEGETDNALLEQYSAAINNAANDVMFA